MAKSDRRGVAAVAVLAAVLLLRARAAAGPDDDAPFQSDGVTPNALRPILDGRTLADYPTNAEPTTGLRILPPTGSQLVTGQRFDLRVETQIPAQAPPKLVRLEVNGVDVAAAFLAKVAAQGAGRESGTPRSDRLLGATARNLHFAAPGIYRVVAEVEVDGVLRRIENELPVAELTPSPRGPRRIVFLLGDGMGQPVRTAARIAGRGVFEGRSRGGLHMDDLAVFGLVRTPSFDSIITDSAPGMTSYVSGVKQPNNALNVSVDNTPEDRLDNPRVEPLFALLARLYGWKTGIVTDAYATDATPAGVVAHARSRRDRFAIAQQMIGFFQDGTAQPATGFAALVELVRPPDVLLGAGAVDWMREDDAELQAFYQYPPIAPDDADRARKRRQDVDLLRDVAPARGYRVVRDAASLAAAPDDGRLLGIFAGEFRKTSSGLGPDNIPGRLDRMVARGEATIRGRGASSPDLGMNVAPPYGTGCGATIRDCFRAVPSKLEMTKKAVAVLDRLAGDDGHWVLLVEQSQTDKLAHVLEYERVVYEALELDQTLGWIASDVARDGRTLVVLTADHAQPETTIGIVLTGAIAPDGATPPGGCFAGDAYPLRVGSDGEKRQPCGLQNAVGTFDDAVPPTYVDADGDGFPDDPDPSVKLVIEDGGRPTYAQDFLTNDQPLEPSDRSDSSLPNPKRDPDGLLLTGNMPTRDVPGAANKSEQSVSVAPHTADDVPLGASGPGETLFGGSYENTGVLPRLAAALGGATTRRDLDRGGASAGVPDARPGAVELRGL
jgi:alkaline phosphatase